VPIAVETELPFVPVTAGFASPDSDTAFPGACCVSAILNKVNDHEIMIDFKAENTN